MAIMVARIAAWEGEEILPKTRRGVAGPASLKPGVPQFEFLYPLAALVGANAFPLGGSDS